MILHISYINFFPYFRINPMIIILHATVQGVVFTLSGLGVGFRLLGMFGGYGILTSVSTFDQTHLE